MFYTLKSVKNDERLCDLELPLNAVVFDLTADAKLTQNGSIDVMYMNSVFSDEPTGACT